MSNDKPQSPPPPPPPPTADSANQSHNYSNSTTDGVRTFDVVTNFTPPPAPPAPAKK